MPHRLSNLDSIATAKQIVRAERNSSTRHCTQWRVTAKPEIYHAWFRLQKAVFLNFDTVYSNHTKMHG
eukprot:m.4170 g.4170  ORF g.4170 m.4170 type:complete len:68 (+) comp3370_c0_seq1:308-511(+)